MDPSCIKCGNGTIKERTIIGQCLSIRFACGHSNKSLTIKDEVSLRDRVKAIVIPKGRGKRGAVIEMIKGGFSSVNSLYPLGVIKSRLIDKRDNRYKERIVDASNEDVVIIDQNEPLSDHRGHGSAKPKQ